jgi:hypothetical protein
MDKFDEIIRAFNKFGVEFLIVGGFGAVIHGAPTATKDIDFLLEQTKENYEHVALAMLDLEARYRGPGMDDLVVPWSGPLIASQIFGNFTCEYGDFDIIKTIPAGAQGNNVGFEELKNNLTEYEFNGLTIYVASLEDIIASKRAANRPKDHLTLPILEKFLKDRNQDSPTLD